MFDQVPLQRPIVPVHSSTFKISHYLILRAILVVSTPDLDLRLWNTVLEEDEDNLDKVVCPCVFGNVAYS